MALRAVVLVGACVGCTSAAPVPELTRVSPSGAAAGSSATITGSNLCGAAGDCAGAGGELDLGLDEPVRAIVTSYAADEIVFTVPSIAPVGATQLVLTVDDDSSNALAFAVLAP